MKVWELGEFGLIDLIARTVGKPSREELVLGIGDDTAAWRTGKSIQLATTDILIQDVHFNLDNVTWRDLGWKALAVNISDIAAMGGMPCYAMVSLGLPPDTEVASVRELYRGIKDIAGKFDVDIVGGNISKAPVAIIDVSLIGKASQVLLTRSAAKPGDLIAVTGYLGTSAAGCRMLKSSLKPDKSMTVLLKKAHLRPNPRVAEAQILAKNGVKAAIDISDGLISDLTHICEASKVGARVQMDRLPVHPRVKAAFKDEAMAMALSGGEDYELLFTAKSSVIDKIRKIMSTRFTVIGEITKEHSGKVTLLDRQGKTVNWDERGWDHFRSQGQEKA
ncbi:MAG: thiamine-phosphate kinase [Chloroflexi bacterium]|nr:thiamine-phosphate kinase [Chloroflexota bacterium]